MLHEGGVDSGLVERAAAEIERDSSLLTRLLIAAGERGTEQMVPLRGSGCRVKTCHIE